MTLKQLAAYPTAAPPVRESIERYIADIPDPQTREMFRLHFVCGLSYSQVARVLHKKMSRHCVISRIRRYEKK